MDLVKNKQRLEIIAAHIMDYADKLSNCKTIWEGSQSEYEALTSKTYDLYMIYEDEEENQNGD